MRQYALRGLVSYAGKAVSKVLSNMKPSAFQLTMPARLAHVQRRPLDGAEYLFYKNGKLGISNGAVWATITSKTPLKRKTLREALVILAERQPLLRASIVETSVTGHKKYLEFIEGPVKIDLEFVDRNHDEPENFTENVFDSIEFKDEGPLWKTFLLREDYDDSAKLYRNVIYIFDAHVIADGHSVSEMVQQTVANMNAIENGTVESLKNSPSFPLFPSNATLLSHKVGWTRWQRLLLFPQLYSAVIRLALSVEPLTNFVNPVLAAFPSIELEKARQIKPATKIITRTISASDTTKLVKRCRSERSSVFGAMSAACHTALCRLLANEPENAVNDLTAGISFRPYHSVQVPLEYVGNYAGGITFTIPLALACESKDFWELARFSNQSVEEFIKKGKHLTFVSLFEAAGEALVDYGRYVSEQELSRRRLSGHCVSNIGTLVHKEKHNDVYHIEDVWLAASSHKILGTFVNFTPTFKGKLNWAICYDANIISNDIAKEYSDLAWQSLKVSFQE